MTDFEKKLTNYAELAVKKGVNIQEGQTLVINASLELAEFVRLVAKTAYNAGARNVHVEWSDDKLTRIKYDMAPEEAFEEYPEWKARGFEELAEKGAAFMTIKGTDPDLLKGVDPKRISAANKAAGKAMDTFRDYIQSDKVSWLVIAAPTREWAKECSRIQLERKLSAICGKLFLKLSVQMWIIRYRHG